MASTPGKPNMPAQQNLFATPVLVDEIKDEEMRAGLEQAILANRNEHPGIQRSNKGGGWHSDVELLQWAGPSAKKLMQHAVRLISQATGESGGRDGKDLAWSVEAWANVNERGGANARHVHGGCYWSAVFYVRVDEGTGSDLVLYDPRMPMLAMHAPHLRFRNAGGEREVRVKPRPGLLIIFPSWLQHEVDPSQGEGLRISIAINFTARPGGRLGPALKGRGRAANAPAIAQSTKEAP